MRKQSSMNPNFQKLLAPFWIVAGSLLILAFFVVNYSMVFKDFSGLDMVEIVFKDLENLKKIGDTTSFLLMVAIPILYLALGIYVFVLGLFSLRKEKSQTFVLLSLFSGIVLSVTILGFFLIGNEGKEVAIVSKFMPKPDVGYFLAFSIELLIFASGILTFMNKPSIEGTNQNDEEISNS